MKLIDKAAVVAEIERRKRKLLDNIICEGDKEWVVRTAHQLNRILLFLDILEMKEVDLEKSISDWLSEGLPNDEEEIDYIKETAKHFFELGMQASNKAQRGE